MKQVQEKLSYTFRQPELLAMALRHSSYANENRTTSYQRLEFLGDSILGMCVAEYLYEKYPQLPEGELTRKRASLVCEEALFKVSQQLELGDKIVLGRGAQKSGVKPSVQADVVEAILGAIYLDSGFPAAKDMVHNFVLCNESVQYSVNVDYKSALQEYVQREGSQNISYETISSTGPDHHKLFVIEVLVNGVAMGQGQGYSKKEGEQQAAKLAYHAFQNK